jgi:hypothetical protein
MMIVVGPRLTCATDFPAWLRSNNLDKVTKVSRQVALGRVGLHQVALDHVRLHQVAFGRYETNTKLDVIYRFSTVATIL